MNAVIETLYARVEEKIAATPVHPMYDIVLDREASGMTLYEVVLEWRAAVEWNAETMKVKHAEWKARMADPALQYRLQTRSMEELRHEPTLHIEVPKITGTLATSGFLVEGHLDDMWPYLLKLIDANFLDTMSKINLEDLGMRWQGKRWGRR